MNWTHRFTIAGWNNNWYLIDVKKPNVCAPEDDEGNRCETGVASWLTLYNKCAGYRIEELNISLENE